VGTPHGPGVPAPVSSSNARKRQATKTRKHEKELDSSCPVSCFRVSAHVFWHNDAIRMTSSVPVAAVLIALAAGVAAQQGHAIHRVPSVPDELLNRPVPLRSGIGAAHDAVATKSKEAQAFYDQGLAYLHSYVWIEAARSFNQALTNRSRPRDRPRRSQRRPHRVERLREGPGGHRAGAGVGAKGFRA
jgi:hypothetical protein